MKKLFVIIFSIFMFTSVFANEKQICKQQHGSYTSTYVEETAKVKGDNIDYCTGVVLFFIKEYIKEPLILKEDMMCGVWQLSNGNKNIKIMQKFYLQGGNKFLGEVFVSFKELRPIKHTCSFIFGVIYTKI